MSPLRPTALAATAVIGCLMSSPCWAGAGAYETALKTFFGQLLALQYDFQPMPAGALVRAAECQAAYVVRGFNADELQRLDSAVYDEPQVDGDVVRTVRQSPEDAQVMEGLMRRVRLRADDARRSGMCDPRLFQ
jgi:hypothetical protein